MSEVNLEELRENARTNYGITNAADLDAERLQSEMDAIDEQARVASKEQADITRNAERASSNAPVLSELGASDGNTTATPGEGTGEGEGEADQGKALSKQTKAELLATAEAESVEVEETDTVPVLREKIAAAREDSADDEEDTPQE